MKLPEAIILQLQQPFMDQKETGAVTGTTEKEILFRQLFEEYYQPLTRYASSLVRNGMVAEELVQEVFCRVWERMDHHQMQQISAAYLYRAIHNESLNHLKRMKRQASYERHAVTLDHSTGMTGAPAESRALETAIRQALNGLPEQCRTIFQMSREEELKYTEIAAHLGISVKTVEAQMSKALRILRKKIAPYLPLMIFYMHCQNGLWS